MLWVKEVEMVESVDDLKSSHSIRGTHGPDFEELDAKIASALNRIIHNARFEKKGQSGGNEGSKRRPFPPRKTDRLPDLRVLPDHWSQRFCRELCRPIYSCSSKWRYSRISIRKFYYQRRKSHLMKSSNQETRSERSSPCYIVSESRL